jgi:hypothetical protein
MIAALSAHVPEPIGKASGPPPASLVVMKRRLLSMSG